MKRTSADTVPELLALVDQRAAPLHLVDDERCDACPGTAVVVVELTSGRDVVLCGSHARRYAPQLLEAGATIVGDYSFEAGLRPSRDIVLAAPVAEGEPAGDKQGRDRQGRWQRFLRRFKKT